MEARRSERVAWLLEELGVPYELDYIRGDVLGSLLQLEQHHEMRMTPIVHIGDVVMVESGAILEYLMSVVGKGSNLRVCEDEKDYPKYLEFIHYAEGTAMAKILADVTENRAFKKMREAGVEPPEFLVLPKLPGLAGQRTGSQRVLHYAENVLAKQQFFGGERFTCADIMMNFPIKLAAVVASNEDYTVRMMQDHEQSYLEQLPKVKEWLMRMTERPAFKRAIANCMPDGAPAF
jgi:glutathione S-transferase